MGMSTLNVVGLNMIGLNLVGSSRKGISRYVPEEKIPPTHVAYVADTEDFNASDAKFYVKKDE